MSAIITNITASLRGDRVLWMILAVLGILSILVVYSASGLYAFQKFDGNTEYFLVRQIAVVGLGFLLAWLMYLMHYTRFSRIAPMFLLVAILMLAATLVFGPEINGARRWLVLPLVNVSLQTSDFAKLALILYIARTITVKQDYIKDFNSAFIPIIIPVIVVCGLIAPSDLSTALILFATCLLMMFMGRVALKYIGLLLFLGFILFIGLFIVGKAYPEVIRSATWVSRVNDFMTNSDGAWHVQQSKIAIAQGEWLGQGPGNSMQRNHLPNPYSDFIYAIIIEEYGLIGGLIVLALYVGLFMRCVSIVTRSPKTYGAMLVLGLGSLMTVQALANMAVAVHLVPVTGLNLPIMSMGGTSMFITCIQFGMILSVSRYIEKNNAPNSSLESAAG